MPPPPQNCSKLGALRLNFMHFQVVPEGKEIYVRNKYSTTPPPPNLYNTIDGCIDFSLMINSDFRLIHAHNEHIQ